MHETSAAARPERELHPPAPASGGYTEDDRKLALEKLVYFSMREEFEPVFREAWEEFWGSLVEELSDEELFDMHSSPGIAFNFQGFYAIEFATESGESLVELFLRRHGEELPRGEEAYLRALAGSQLGIYELAVVRPGAGFALRDLRREGEEILFEDPVGSFGIREGQILATRLTRAPGGRAAFAWDLYVFPASYREELLAELTADGTARAAGNGGESGRDFSRRACPLVHRLLLELSDDGSSRSAAP